MWIFNPLKGKFETTDSKVKPLSKVSVPNWLGLNSDNILFRGDKTCLNLYAGNPLWKKRIIEDLIKGLRFSYRKKITVTEQSGNDLTDYQVLIELNSTNFDFSHSDGNDIRFYDGEIFLPYWVEKWDSVNQEAKIWVKVPSIPANGNTSFYMYYGNPVLLSASSTTLTFIREIDGCVLALPMDEGSGDTVYDKSGNDNDGTIYDATWTDGKFGKALSFDGEDDYVDLGHPSSLNIDTNSFSIEAWAKPSTVTTKYKYIAGRVGYHKGIYRSYDYYGFSMINSENEYYRAESPTETAVIGEWAHVVGVFDKENSKIYLYLNGQLADTEDFIGDPKVISGDWEIGRLYSSDYAFKGLIDEVRIFNRALSEEEIQDLYNYYGYNTENYPGKTLVRKYVEPEPSISVGSEEIA